MTDDIEFNVTGPAQSVVRIAYRSQIRTARLTGFIAGLIVMALLNIGDVHLCVGECDAKGITLAEVFTGAGQ